MIYTKTCMWDWPTASHNVRRRLPHALDWTGSDVPVGQMGQATCTECACEVWARREADWREVAS